MNLAGTANRQVWMHGWSFQYQVCQLSKYSGGSVLRYMWRLTLKILFLVTGGTVSICGWLAMRRVKDERGQICRFLVKAVAKI